MSEKAGALLMLEKIVGQFPRLVKVFADGGYEGKDFAQKIKDDHHLDLEVVKRISEQGFSSIALAMDSGAHSGMDSKTSTTDH